MKLDIGCGDQKKEGFFGLDRHDFSRLYEKDEFLQHDLRYPIPFGDNCIDMIWTHHMLEHLPHRHPDIDMDFLIFVINEFHRVLRPGAEAHIIVPWIEHTNAWRSPSHYRFFNYDYWNWFSHGTRLAGEHEAHGLEGPWKIAMNKIQDDCHVYAILVKEKYP